MNQKTNQTNIPRAEYHLFHTLNRIERLSINIVYLKKWRTLVKAAKLGKLEATRFKVIFKELHAQYYKRVVLGPPYVTTSRLVVNFLISKTQENLRATVQSFSPYNASAFIGAVRSQIEVNALVNKFILDSTYHKEHLIYNEDRSKAKELKTVININTLVEKLKYEPINYIEQYGELSLLLHPNPSAIKFYAQATGTPTENGSGIFSPKIKRYFEETITPDERYNAWFKNKTWLLFFCIEHFIMMIGALKNDFFVTETEEQQFNYFAMANFLDAHKNEIIKAANNAGKVGADISEAVNETIDRILNRKNGHQDSSSQEAPPN